MKKLSPLLNWIKEAATNVWRFVLGVFLIFLAAFVFVVVCLSNAAHYLITVWSRKLSAKEILLSNGSFAKMVAIGIDILGCISGSGVFNWLFLKEVKQFPFGIAGQRISSVIQWNYLINNLSKSGMRLYKLLEFLEKDHCNKSVQVEIDQAIKIIELNSAILKAST